MIKNKLFFIALIILVSTIVITESNAIESDNSYKSPTSDKNYKSPTSDKNYIAPKSDNNYTSPTIGSGYIKPNTYDVSSNGTTIINNETISYNNKTQKTNNTINEVIENKTLEHNNKTKIDKKFVGEWRVYSESFYTGTGDFKYRTTPDTILTIKEDGTWSFGDFKGTWEIDYINEEDWQRWGVKDYGPLRKIIFNGWNDTITQGPVEEDGAIIQYIWSIEFYKNGGSDWFKFGSTGTQKLYVELKGKGKILSGDQKINCGEICTGEYIYDYPVQLRAFPEEGYNLVAWGGACYGTTEDICIFTIKHPTTVIAEFGAVCTDNSQCSLDQQCTNSTCITVNCECGSINNHQCQKYACCSDKDCDEGNTCDVKTHQCIAKSQCKPYLIKGDSSDKLDLVIVGDGFTDYKILNQSLHYILDYENKYNGVFSVSPFKENKDKFNIWMVIAPDYQHYEDGNPVREDIERFTNACERDTVVVLSRNTYRPFAFFPSVGSKGGVVYHSIGFAMIRGPEVIGRILLHELGHALAGLADEYVEYGKGPINVEHSVNCASDIETAKKKWGDLVGVEDVGYYTGIPNILGTTYYKSPYALIPELGRFPDGSDWGDGGCDYDWKNIRPTIGSIMRDGSEFQYDFGPVNERELSKALEEYK